MNDLPSPAFATPFEPNHGPETEQKIAPQNGPRIGSESVPPADIAPADAADLAQLRRSTRGFLADPLPEGLLARLLMTARRAPSGANLQPGTFIAVEGDARARLSAALVDAWRNGLAEAEDYDYFPRPMPMHLKRRQLAAAQALYGALGVERQDRAGRDRQFERNFAFFDAPVALVVTIDRDFGAGGYMDLGMTLYGLMLAAQGSGLGCCAIGALASYPGLIRKTLGLDARSAIVCGIALGVADPNAPVNETTTSRCELDEYFTTIR